MPFQREEADCSPGFLGTDGAAQLLGSGSAQPWSQAPHSKRETALNGRYHPLSVWIRIFLADLKGEEGG